MAEALDVLTARQPLILVLEDLHWSDHSTVELVAYLLRRQGSGRLFLLGTYRPMDLLTAAHPLRQVVQDSLGRGWCAEVRLGLLGEAELRQYLGERLQENAISGLPFTELGHWLYQRTEGNPLFMVTMVEHLLREGILAGEPSVAAKPLPLPERASALVERVQELREELAEAESFHDVGRVARLQAELEAVTESLVQQQTRSQQKASPSPDERLRLNVTRAIKTAIKKIASVHPLLGRYLTQTIKTGTTCSYTPPDSFSIDRQM